MLLPGYVNGPPAQPQRGGLQALALPGETGVDWRKGVQCWPENAAGWRMVHDAAVSDDDVEIDRGNQDDDPAPVAARPFMIQTSVRGPKLGHQSELFPMLRGRVQRRLDAITSQAVARELWTGELTRAQPYDLPGGYDWTNPAVSTQWTNAYLASADAIVADAALPAMEALGEVEAQLAARVAGGPLYLHIPLRILSSLAWALRQTGDLLRTAAGSIVVPDHGYPGWGAGEDDDTVDPGLWMWGTGPVQLWLDDVDVYDRPTHVVDVSNNEIEMWAERPALVLFDPQTLVGCAVSTP